jgi:hypothetical protein
VPLSEEELRMLEQMERALVEEDPKLASTLRGNAFQRQARLRAVIAGVAFAGGIALLLAGVIWPNPIVGVVGFVVMLGSAIVGVTALRAPAAPASEEGERAARETDHPGFGVVDGGKKHRPHRPHRPHRSQGSHGSMMERFEERWRRRRERGI